MNPSHPEYRQWLRDQAALAILSNFHFGPEDVKKLQAGEMPDHKLVAQTAINCADVFVRQLELRDKQTKRYQFAKKPTNTEVRKDN